MATQKHSTQPSAGARWRETRLRVRNFYKALQRDLARGRARREPVTGFWIQHNVLEWTTLVDGKRGLEKTSFGRVTLDGVAPGGAEPDKLAEQIRRACPGLAGRVSLGLLSAQTLPRVVDLPSTDTAEMEAMVKLQLDKFSPFPEERAAYSYEWLQPVPGGGRVLIVAAQKDTVDQAQTLCRQVGLELQRVDADVMGWWRLLSDARAVPRNGRHLLLVLEETGGLILGVEDGALLAVKTLAGADGMAAAEYAAEIVHELESFVIYLDLESGGAELAGIELWQRAEQHQELTGHLQATLPRQPVLRDLNSLPPLSEGLARRMLRPYFDAQSVPGRGTAAVLDLIPAAGRQQAEVQRIKRRLMAASILILGLWALLAGGFQFAFMWQQQTLQKVEARKEKLQRPADDVRAMQRRAREFEQYLDQRQSVLECLLEVSQNLPQGITLTAFSFKKGKTISLRGEALSVNPIYDFKHAMDKSELFGPVDLGSIQPNKRKNETVQTFTMTLHLAEGQQ